jgi:hypothetical protein
MLKRSATLFIICLFLPSLVLAQETTGRIEGWVLDPEGNAVPQTTLTAMGGSLLGSRSTTVLPDGYFQLKALPPGAYDLRVTAEGFQEIVLTDLKVRLGSALSTGEIRLEPEIYEMEEMVVSARGSLVDPGETSIGGNLVSDEFADLPIDRNYRNLTTLLPHVQESYLGDDLNFAGGTGSENKWYVDGVDVTNPVTGSQGMELPYNFVQEVQVRSGGYQAEYRGAQGGVIDAVTHSGSNEFRGQGFGFFLNDQLVGSPQLGVQDPEQGSFARWDIGASAAGPVVRDRLWYFLAYNPAFDSEDTEIPGQGVYTDEYTTHRFAGKLDWLVNDANDLTLSVVGNPQQGDITNFVFNAQTYLNPDPALVTQDLSTIMTSLSGRHFLGNNSLLQSTLSGVWNDFDYAPRTQRGADELYFFDMERSEVSGGTLFTEGPNYEKGFDFTAGLNGTFPVGAHTLKAGLEYRQNGIEVKQDAGALIRGGSDAYILVTLGTHGKVINRLPAVFVQDAWRVTERLRLNLGVRWSGQYLAAEGDDREISISDQWQPRLGLTYLLGQQRHAKIFGSAGRFYQDLSLWAPANILVEESYYREVFFDQDPRDDPTGGTVITELDNQRLVEDLKGQHFDEVTLGYERQVGTRGRFTVRGIFREIQEAVEDGTIENGSYIWGNPGRGSLSVYPKPSRDYTALELAFQLTGGRRTNLLASYVLSRTRGNTSGIFASDPGNGMPNIGVQWDSEEMIPNGYGLLPNDRTHVLKLSGSWRAGYGISVGSTFAWMKGTPLNEFGGTSTGLTHVFLVPRGTAGRTPDIWDLNLRLVYDLAYLTKWENPARLIVDLLHVGSPRKETNYDQVHYTGQDENGNQINPSPTYGLATAYQPPFAVRLGLEIGF